MSEVRLKSLHLRNFKGVGDFTLYAAGDDMDIYGDNATGKTTLMDAWLWLLFAKDSQNQSDFEVKTLQPSGEPIHGFDHEVEGVLTIDGTDLTLRKCYREKWVKKRGSANSEFSGHTTDYWVDGVPAKKGEYDTKVTAVCDESAFRLLTDPAYFNLVMKWQDRRTLLLNVCGDISQDDVIAADSSLSDLPEILAGRSIEDHRKVITAKRSAINEELKKIPVRIDEVSQSLPEPIGMVEAVESDLKKLRAQAQEKHQERARIESGGQVAEKNKELRELEGDLILIERRMRDDAGAGAEATEQERRLWRSRLDEADRLIASKQRDIETNDIEIQRLKDAMENGRATWAEINSRKFAPEKLSDCPICGAAPEHQTKHDPAKALAEFNRQKSEQLEVNNTHGCQLKTQASNIALMSEQARQEMAEAEEAKAEIQEKLDSLPAPAQTVEIDYGADANWSETNAAIDTLKAEIETLRGGNSEALAAVESAIRGIQEQIKDLDAALAEHEQAMKGQERIRELGAREKVLAAEYEDLEKQLYLTEEFIRTKVRMLESRINERFEMARFKLFNQLVNGGIEECCETTFEGIPYSDLNNGARINVGLDIINTLSDHYGFAAPIVVDNAEAVTVLVETRGQLIRLIVSEPDKELRVETKERKAMA